MGFSRIIIQCEGPRFSILAMYPPRVLSHSFRLNDCKDYCGRTWQVTTSIQPQLITII
jgi:hypothetical protein